MSIPVTDVSQHPVAGSGKGLFGMSLPMPSLTGGSSGPAVSGGGYTYFGDIYAGGGMGFWGWTILGSAVVVGVVLWRAVKK